MLAPLHNSLHSRGMMIAVVNQKGGVGKTTLAVHLAAWHLDQGRRVAFIDADGQSSSTRWIGRAAWKMTLATETQADTIIELAADFRRKHDIVVADGPASLSESSRALLLAADRVLIPCGVSVTEIESTLETVRMLYNARRIRGQTGPDATLVLTRIRSPRFRLTQEAHETLRALNLPLCEHQLALREAFADAPGQGSVVWQMGKRAQPAAREMTQLLEEIEGHAREATHNDGNPYGRAATVSARPVSSPA